ncbi:hypothetical protein [Actinopolymorpha alba]|uniref:hypothetical protein n=1 Tax=Actinopolymorpha alba TaxID=533267 RepID=UPI0003A53759|nr:hypothetical protein [Actinopolymorpha alba]
MFVRGEPTRYAQKARTEARRAAELLAQTSRRQVKVEPLVVIVGALRVRGRRTEGVRILARSALLWHLMFRERQLDSTERDVLYEVARRSTTWQR